MKTEPRLHEALHATITTYGDVSEYVAAIESLGLWERLTTDPEEFVPWLHAAINYGNSTQEFFYPTSAKLLDAIEHKANALAGRAIRLRINFFHLDYPDALLAAGVQQSQIRFDPSWLHPVFDGWIAQHHRDLGCLLSNERIREELSRNFRFDLVIGNVDAFLGATPAREFLSSILEWWRDRRRELTGFLGEWAAAESTLKLIAAEPRLREINPQAVAEILHCDAAEELAARLRLGTLVEYTWPAFEQGAVSLIGTNETAPVGEAFPYVSVRKGKKLVLFDGETTRSLLIPDTAPPIAVVWHAFPIDDDVLIIYENALPPYDYEWMWLSDCQPHLMPDGSFDAVSFNYPQKIGGNPVLAAGHRVSPVGIRLGFGPTYVADAMDSENLTVLPCGECIPVEEFDRHFAAGTLNGLDIPEAAAVAAESGVPLSFSKSFTATATDSTAHSPCGVDGNRLYGFSFSGYLDDVTFQTCFVSPLGTFCSHKIPDFFAVEKPASTIWYVCEPEFYDDTIRLYDAATENQIAPSLTHTGDLHVLNYLRPAGFHHLRVRNEKVSANMRACTTEQARALLDDPLSILDFAEGDETLAAAIAGIIAQIRHVAGATLSLPALESVPEFLTYLYKVAGYKNTDQ